MTELCSVKDNASRKTRGASVLVFETGCILMLRSSVFLPRDFVCWPPICRRHAPPSPYCLISEFHKENRTHTRGGGDHLTWRPGTVPSPGARQTAKENDNWTPSGWRCGRGRGVEKRHSQSRLQTVSRLSLYKKVFHVKALLWESIILLLPPSPAKPTVLLYYCTTIVQYTPPHRPPLLCHTPYNFGDGNIV